MQIHAGPPTPTRDNTKAPSEVELWTLALALPVQAHSLVAHHMGQKTSKLHEETLIYSRGLANYMGVSENSVPLNPMVLLIIIPMKNG